MIRPFKWYQNAEPGQRIKYKGELTDGKIGCCCELPPGECCLYPAEALGSGYTIDDLPASITVMVGATSYTFVKDDDPLVSGFLYIYGETGYIDQAFGSLSFHLFLVDGSVDIREGSHSCLIGLYIDGDGGEEATSEDEFSSSYLVTYDNGDGLAGTITVERVSQTTWFGINEAEEASATVYYTCPGEFEEFPYKWYAGVTFEIEPSLGVGGYKTSPQNKPDGSYVASPPGTISVS